MAANDNQPRTPAEHRALVAEQATTGERAYQGGSWPQGKRYHKAGNMRHLAGLAGWQVLNRMPRLSAANDNTVNADYTEITESDIVDADDIMAAVEKEKKEPGEHYREGAQEVFVRGAWRPIVGVTGSDRKHSAGTPDWAVDDMTEEDKVAAVIDRKRIREKLGGAVCTLLDMAASGATTGEIAEAIGVSRTKAEKYVDAVIEKYLQTAA